LVSGGWCFLIMALFYLLVDMWGWRKLAFPLAVIGMNSIAIYVMAHLFKGFIRDALRTHLGTDQFSNWAKQINPDPKIAAALEQTLLGAAILLILWLILLWMYRRKIFLRI
jgi:heparan-alpha-glucosaminide N-acetyltransferase